METVMHRPWKISVHAKAKNFDLKFTASKILPSWEFLETRFSVLIKVHSFLLKLRSETGVSDSDTSVATQTRRRNKRSKFLTLFDRLFSTTTTTTTTLKRIRLKKVVEDFVEKRRGTRRFTNFKYEFLSLLDKFRVKRGVRNRAAAAAAAAPTPGIREMPRLPREIHYYKEELMMGSLLVGYLLISRSSPPVPLLVMDKLDQTVLGINYIILLHAFTLFVLIYAIVVLMKKSNFTCWKRSNPHFN